MATKCRAKDPSTCRTHGQPQSESLHSAVEAKDVSRYLDTRESMENASGNASQSVEALTQLVAEDMSDIARYKVSVRDDGTGPYIVMKGHNPSERLRFLSLTSSDGTSAPTWQYWTSTTPNRRYDSHVGKEATVKEVSKFLFKSFKREMSDDDRDALLNNTEWVPTKPRWPERTHFTDAANKD